MKRYSYFCVVCTVLLFIFGFLAGGSLAWSQVQTQGSGQVSGQVSGPSSAHTACAADVDRFCPNEKGIPNIINCLKKHEAQLSPKCKNHGSAGPTSAPSSSTSHR